MGSIFIYLFGYTESRRLTKPHGLQRSLPDLQLEFFPDNKLHGLVDIHSLTIVDHLIRIAINLCSVVKKHLKY